MNKLLLLWPDDLMRYCGSVEIVDSAVGTIRYIVSNDINIKSIALMSFFFLLIEVLY